ncbi:MAG: lamin tail domain-containing protein [Labilithrix sp.]|nr:lamin tail domain-containing protein [Labilithrix sp.]MCW5817953.1 lamin tail domain-containing protein [Labilithrix sp.]
MLRKNTFLLGISLAGALAVAVGCSGEEEDTESATSDIVQSQDLVISQVYGGGGNAGAVYTHDFVELFNRGKADVELGGKVLQYAAAASSFSATKDIVKLPAFTLKPGKYYVVQLAPGSATPVGDPLPKADYVASQPGEVIAMGKDKGKVALTTEADALVCGKADAPCEQEKLDALIDFVGYGAANQYEGNPTGALGSDKAAIRRGGGCAETGDNSSDFDTSGPPAPHLTDSPDCDSVDASVPPPVSADAAAPRPDAGSRPDASTPKPRDAGKADASKPSDAGSAPDDTDDDRSEEEDDDDDSATSSGSVTRKPSKKAASTTSTGAPPPQFVATAPDACAMTSGPTGSSTGFTALFGLALALVTLRRSSPQGAALQRRGAAPPAPRSQP